MAISLTAKERNFLENGGSLLYVRNNHQGWEIVRMEWEGENTISTNHKSESNAAALLFVLADLVTIPALVAIHHSVSRSTKSRAETYPKLL